MNTKPTKSYSIEEMAKKLTKLKDKKEKLDSDIVDLQSQLDESLKALGISPHVIYKDDYPTIYNPVIVPEITPQSQWWYSTNDVPTQQLDFTSTVTFGI